MSQPWTQKLWPHLTAQCRRASLFQLVRQGCPRCQVSRSHWRVGRSSNVPTLRSSSPVLICRRIVSVSQIEDVLMECTRKSTSHLWTDELGEPTHCLFESVLSWDSACLVVPDWSWQFNSGRARQSSGFAFRLVLAGLTPVMCVSWGMCFWDTKGQSDLLGTPKSLFGIQNAFFGIQKVFLTFSQVKGVSWIVKLLLTFWKVKSVKGVGSTVGDPKSSRKSTRNQQHTKQEKQHKETEAATSTEKAKYSSTNKQSSKNNRKHKQQAAQAEASWLNSSTNSIKQQQHRKKAAKGSAKAPKGSAKAPKGSAKAAKAAAKAAQTVQTATKTGSAATGTRGLRRRGAKGLFVLSLASSRGISVVFSMLFLRYRWIL